MVVEFNQVMCALMGCNTNVSILGSEAQSKAIICYLLKYITKAPMELSHILSLYHNARQNIENFPSIAKDSGTDTRTAMHFFARIVNQLIGAVEVSTPVASLALLGMPSETCSHGFFYVFIKAAINYAVKHPQYIKEDENEFADLPG